MLGFLRRIRRSLIEDGHLRKYLVYAVGEILLVMIGILLALQVNNWNESRKSELELNLLVENLKQEFETNAAELAQMKAEVQSTMEATKQLLSNIGDSELTISESELDSLIEMAFYWPTWIPTNSVSEELKNSGKLSSLNHEKMKDLLFKWERQFLDINEWNRRMEEGSQGVIDYVRNNGSLRNVNAYRIGLDRSRLRKSNIDLMQDIGFENQLDVKFINANFLLEHYQDADLIIDDMIKETGDYLKSHSD